MSEKRKRLVDTLESALDRLDAVLQQPKNEFMRDSAIQRFEFTFELFWKALKALGDESGLRTFSPRDALRAGFQLGVLVDSPEWFRMLEHRNLTSHTYNVVTAEAIYARLPDYARMMREPLGALKKRT